MTVAESHVPAWLNSVRRSSSLVLKFKLPTKSFLPMFSVAPGLPEAVVCREPALAAGGHIIGRWVSGRAATKTDASLSRTHKDTRAGKPPQTRPRSRTPLESVGVGHRLWRDPLGVEVHPHLPRAGVGHGEEVLEIGGGADEDPVVAVAGAVVEHLDEQVQAVRRDEPEEPGAARGDRQDRGHAGLA